MELSVEDIIAERELWRDAMYAPQRFQVSAEYARDRWLQLGDLLTVVESATMGQL